MKITIEIDDNTMSTLGLDATHVLSFLALSRPSAGAEYELAAPLSALPPSDVLHTQMAGRASRPTDTGGVFSPEWPETENSDDQPADVARANGATPVDIDRMGLAWDPRIHSSNQKKTADGMWQRRRNVPPAEFDRIVSECKAGRGAPEKTNALEPEELGHRTLAPEKASSFAPENAAPRSFAPENAAPSGGGERWTFPLFLRAHNDAMTKGFASNSQLQDVLGAFNLESVAFLAAKPELLPQVAQAMGYAL